MKNKIDICWYKRNNFLYRENTTVKWSELITEIGNKDHCGTH